MNARTFNNTKMQWLNAICRERDLGATAFRVAYLIADHFNRVAGYAWPSYPYLADQIFVSTKSVQRAIGSLEKHGWLHVDRSRNQSNKYRMIWPAGRSPPPLKTQEANADKIVSATGQDSSEDADTGDPRTYLTKHPKNYSSRLVDGSDGGRFRDRGKYEMQIIDRHGPGAGSILEGLNELAPAALDNLCRKERRGDLTKADLDAARLLIAQHQNHRDGKRIA